MAKITKMWVIPEFKEFCLKKRAENPQKYKTFYDVQRDLMNKKPLQQPRRREKRSSFWGKL